MEIHVANKQRSAELAITNFISNKREWNTCFTKFPIFDDAVWMYYKCYLNLINQKSILLPSAWIKWTWIKWNVQRFTTVWKLNTGI